VEWAASESKVRTCHHPRNHGWPSIEGGVEVTIKVCSDALKSEEKRSTCRSLMILECFSVLDLLSLLCHNAVGTSFGRCAFPGSRQGTD
jgi:hypothetical protein